MPGCNCHENHYACDLHRDLPTARVLELKIMRTNRKHKLRRMTQGYIHRLRNSLAAFIAVA